MASIKDLMKDPAQAKEAFVSAVRSAVDKEADDSKSAVVVEQWLSSGAKLEWLSGATGNYNFSLPVQAAFNGKLRVLKAMVKAKGKDAVPGLDLDKPTGWNDFTSLTAVIVRDGEGWRNFTCSWAAEAVGLLLDMGASIEKQQPCKQSQSDAPMIPLTPLQVAAKYAKPDICEVLVKRGANKEGAVKAAVASWMNKGQGSASMAPNGSQIPATISKLVALGCPVTVEDFKALLYKETKHPEQSSLTDKVLIDMAKALPQGSKAAALDVLLTAIKQSKANGECNVSPAFMAPARRELGWTGIDPPPEALEIPATMFFVYSMPLAMMKAYGQAGTDQYKGMEANANKYRKATIDVAQGIKPGADGSKAVMFKNSIAALGVCGDAQLVGALKNGFDLSSGADGLGDLNLAMFGYPSAKGTTALHLAVAKALNAWDKVASMTQDHRSKFTEPGFRAKDSAEEQQYRESKSGLSKLTDDAKKAVEYVKVLVANGASGSAKDADGKTVWDLLKASDKAGGVAGLFLGLAL